MFAGEVLIRMCRLR